MGAILILKCTTRYNEYQSDRVQTGLTTSLSAYQTPSDEIRHWHNTEIWTGLVRLSRAQEHYD